MYLHVHLYICMYMYIAHNTVISQQSSFTMRHDMTVVSHANYPLFPPPPSLTQNTGIIVTLTIFSSCVCCVSYVGLCCDLPSKAKIFGAIGITLVAIMFTIYTAWMMGGFYLVVTFDTSALFTDVCRNVLAYTLLLGVYFVTVCVVGVVWCVWRVREVSRRERSTPRQRVRGTKPQFQVL